MELVDREKLIAQHSANPESKDFMELTQDNYVVQALKKAEVVDAEPVVHARWIKSPYERVCPVCKDRHSYYGWSEWNFCKNCGAKMDLE